MTFESGLTFFFAILVFAVTPGPGVFALLARALVSGAKSCFSLALGMAISDIIYLILACYGLAVIAENWTEAFTVVRIVGAAYLLYLGWKMWTTPTDQHLSVADGMKRNEFKSFTQGFLISASNPKVILFYIAFLPTFMDLSALSSSDIAIASFLTLLGLMMGLMLIACSASSARHFFSSEKAMRRLNRSAGSLMMAAGGYLAIRS